MTAVELVSAIVFGLIGFFAVSYFLRHKSSGKKDGMRGSEEVQDRAQQDETPAWYEVLEVPANATQSEIKNAYRRQVQKYHPDRVSGLGNELQSLALKKTQEITAAYKEATRSS